jgi:hypothetical protein
MRAAALGAAERSWGERPDVWALLRRSRAARLAWAATVVALAASHLLFFHESPSARVGVAVPTLATNGGPEMAEVTDVLEIRIAPIAWVGEGLSRGSNASPRRAPKPKKEAS